MNACSFRLKTNVSDVFGCVFNVIIQISMVNSSEFNEILGIQDIHKLPIQLLHNYLQLFSPVSYHFV